MTPQITIPPKRTRYAHMFKNKHGHYVAIHRCDGKQVRTALLTDDLKTAIERRDALFESLRKQGAVDYEDKRKTSVVERAKKKGVYIHRRAPYVVRVAGTWVGEAETLEEAEKLKREFVGKLKS